MNNSLPTELKEAIAAFNGDPLEVVIARVAQVITGTHEAVRCYGITLSKDSLAPELRRLNKRFNRGRVRKVSVKRPSPWLSKSKYMAIQAAARVNTLTAALYLEVK